MFSRTLILGAAVATLAGCGAAPKQMPSPIAGINFEGKVVSRGVSVARDEAIKDIYDEIREINDDAEKEYVSAIINKEVPLSKSRIEYADDYYSCESKKDYFKDIWESALMQFPAAIDYTLKHYPASVSHRKPSITNSLSVPVKTGDATISQDLLSNMLWRWPTFAGAGAANKLFSEESGFVKVNFTASVSCNTKRDLEFKVNVPSYTVKDPSTALKIAELSVDWDKANQLLHREFVYEYVARDKYKDYKEWISRIASKINSSLEHRYSVNSVHETIRFEKLYNLKHSIADSRLQRSLDSYKFSTENTRYEYTDSITGYKYPSTKTRTIVKTYPEEGDKTSVVFTLEYFPVFDAITGKQTISKDEANKYLEKQIDYVSKILKN